MKIAMMTNNYKPFVGGVPISIERLANGLRELGHTVYIFAPDYKSAVSDDKYTFRFPTTDKKIAGAIPVPTFVYAHMKKIFSTLQIDIIHVHHPVLIGNVAVRIGKEFQIPVVYTYHTRYEQYLHYLKPFGYLQSKADSDCNIEKSVIDFVQQQIIQRYLNHFIGKCDLVLAPTESMRNFLRKFDFDTPISVAPTGLPQKNFEIYPCAKTIRHQFLQGKKYLFCTVSRLAKEKNISFLLHGIAEVKAQLGNIFNVIILGDGPEKTVLQKRAAEMGLADNVFFLGGVPNSEIPTYHQACDLFIFSSKSETQGIVLLEAMAAYLPVVAITATGVSDVVENGINGMLSSDSVEEWANNLVLVLKNKEIFIGMKIEARKTALRYSEKIIAKKVLNDYQYLQKSYDAERWLYLHLDTNNQPMLIEEN